MSSASHNLCGDNSPAAYGATQHHNAHAAECMVCQAERRIAVVVDNPAKSTRDRMEILWRLHLETESGKDRYKESEKNHSAHKTTRIPELFDLTCRNLRTSQDEAANLRAENEKLRADLGRALDQPNQKKQRRVTKKKTPAKKKRATR